MTKPLPPPTQETINGLLSDLEQAKASRDFQTADCIRMIAERDAARAESDGLAQLLARAMDFIQHINEVENSSCFYGCTCGAEKCLVDISAALLPRAQPAHMGEPKGSGMSDEPKWIPATREASGYLENAPQTKTAATPVSVERITPLDAERRRAEHLADLVRRWVDWYTDETRGQDSPFKALLGDSRAALEGRER